MLFRSTLEVFGTPALYLSARLVDTRPRQYRSRRRYHKDKDISLNQNGYIQAIAQRFKNDLGDKLEIFPHSGDGLKLPTNESLQVPLNDVMRQKYMELIDRKINNRTTNPARTT